jgi:hypothetical protein
MAWEEIAPRAGSRTGRAGVTCAWREVAGGWRLIITIGDEVRRQLDLDAGDYVTAQRDRTTNKLRLAKAKTGWRGHRRAWPNAEKGAHCICYNLPLDDIRMTAKKPAQQAAWQIEGGALVVTLPPWCATFVQVAPRAIPLREAGR